MKNGFVHEVSCPVKLWKPESNTQQKLTPNLQDKLRRNIQNNKKYNKEKVRGMLPQEEKKEESVQISILPEFHHHHKQSSVQWHSQESSPQSLNEHYANLEKSNTMEVILDNLKTILVRMESHQLCFLHYGKLRRCLEFPRSMITAFLSSTLSVNIISEKRSPLASYASFSLAAISLALDVIIRYCDFHPKEKQHDQSYKLYTTLFRSAQVKILQNHLSPKDKTTMLQDMLSQLSILEEYEEFVPTKFVTQAEKNPHVYDKLKLGHHL